MLKEHLCESLFFHKVAGMQSVFLSQRDSNTLFLCKFAKVLRIPFLQNTYGGLLLNFGIQQFPASLVPAIFVLAVQYWFFEKQLSSLLKRTSC